MQLWKRGEKAEFRLQQLKWVQKEQQAWFHRTMMDGLLQKRWDTERLVLQIKVLAGFLATRVTHYRGQLEPGEGGCRFCGQDTGRKEDNMHIMWECVGSTALVAARRQVVRGIRKVWTEVGVGVDDVALLGAVWELGRDGALRAGKWEQLAGVLGEVQGHIINSHSHLCPHLPYAPHHLPPRCHQCCRPHTLPHNMHIILLSPCVLPTEPASPLTWLQLPPVVCHPCG
jgi:hypothetical protein